MDPELIEYLDRRFTQLKDELRTEIRAEIRADIATSAEETRRYVDTVVTASAVETRRHFDVMAERLMDKIQLVGEGVLGVNNKVERLATEMRGEFQKVDRRFLHLQARIIDRRD